MRGKQVSGFPSRQEVLTKLFEKLSIPDMRELVPLREAIGRVTAEKLYSVNTLPVCRVSGCDGIAVKSALFADGMPDYTAWQPGVEFQRADTGDDFPDVYDAVIMIEEVDLASDGRILAISPDIAVRAGDNVSVAGNTMQPGDLLIEENMPIRPTDLAALAIGGVSMVPVRKKPLVAFIPTGSELVPAGVAPYRGKNVDCNSLLAEATIRELGGEPLVFPIVPDIRSELRARLEEALSAADIVVVNAGTAKGEEDFNFGLLGNRGEMICHYVAAAPGRPLAMAVIDGKPVVNLPGPAMAAFFGMDWCLRAIISAYLHLPAYRKPAVQAVLMEDIHSTPHMAILCKMEVRRHGGRYEAYPVDFKKTRAGAYMGTNGMFVCDVGVSFLPAGTLLEVELLRGEEFIREVE